MASRRWGPLAVASVVMATLAGAVLLRAVFEDGDGSPAAPDPTPVPTSVAGASVSTTPAPPIALVDAVLEKRMFAAGEQVSAEQGIGFLKAGDGSLETWSRRSDSTGPAYSLVATPDGALLVVYGTEEDGAPWVVERATGKTWKLREDIEVLPALAHGTVVAVARRSPAARQPALLDFATGALREFGPALTDEVEHAVLMGAVAPDGQRIAVHIGDEVSLVDLATGRMVPLVDGVPNDGHTRVQALAGALGFTVDTDEIGGTRRWIAWDGVEVQRDLGPASPSPGGRYMAEAWTPGPIRAAGMGAHPSVGTVTIRERQSDTPLVRFAGAEPMPFLDQAWSASGDSLVLQVAEGYRVMSAAGSTIAVIPDPVHVLDPRPSPTTPGLLGTNRGTIINVARGTTVAPLYAADPWRAHWSSRPGELIVELSSPGKGRDWPEDVLPFEVQTEGLKEPPAVTANDACAPLRERPEPTAGELACLASEERGRITAVTDPAPGGAEAREVAGVQDTAGRVWLHVELEDGESGWAEAEGLAWAN